ncbi:MAG TPA: hypothetical protein VIF60_24100 [Burkholderiaceae bacterium]|jgi:hypothetical protein
MTIRRSLILVLCLLMASCGTPSAPKDSLPASCEYDSSRLLGLDEYHFDQDDAGGWRTLASKPGCDLVAADLLRDYRQAHGNAAGILYWHEGQLRALAGQSASAIVLMERSRKPADADRAGWNQYVDATIAYLHKDRSALEQARAKLAAVEPPIGDGLPPVKDGYMEVHLDNGRMMKFLWPPNIDVVDGLLQCFDKPYEVAYGSECRVRSH